MVYPSLLAFLPRFWLVSLQGLRSWVDRSCLRGQLAASSFPRYPFFLHSPEPHFYYLAFPYLELWELPIPEAEIQRIRQEAGGQVGTGAANILRDSACATKVEFWNAACLRPFTNNALLSYHFNFNRC